MEAVSDWQVNGKSATGPQGAGADVYTDDNLCIDYEYPLCGGGTASGSVRVPIKVVAELLQSVGYTVTLTPYREA
jgi:hypothetical protein